MKKRTLGKVAKKNLGKILLGALLLGVCMGSNVAEVKAEYKKVSESELPLSTMSVYREMDTTFLKTFPFGTTYEGEVFFELETAQQMMESTDIRLKEGRVVQTSGFYEAGDGGGATYMLATTQAEGAIALENGLYANIIMDTKVIDGKNWGVINPKQLGAKGDGMAADDAMINNAIVLAGALVENDASIFRAIVYLPEGEYKCTDLIKLGAANINFVGDGNQSVIFTDNDYRTDKAYSEFFFSVWGATNVYMADFYVEAREVNGYKYMRQMGFVYCDNVYTYQVDLNIPQEAFSKDYYVDKQYSSVTYYSGNKNMTLDSCKLELMCSTYRGANIGVLDFYSSGEENITIMNCELHSDARDEQVGIFTPSFATDDAYVNNVYFVNNTMYSYQPLDKEAANGWRNMCFTVAYEDSKRISNIYIKGNHFIADLDSKLMTFGNGLTNCEVANNMMEIRSTAHIGAFIFDSSATTTEQVLIQDNEIYLTDRDTANTGKAAILGGKGVVKGNKIVSDTRLDEIGYDGGIYEDNTYINFGFLDYVTNNLNEFNNNKIISYGLLNKIMYQVKSAETVNYTGNSIWDYRRVYDTNTSDINTGLTRIQDTYTELNFTDNTYIAPNKYYKSQADSTKSSYVPALLFYKATIDKVNFKNNKLQGAKSYFAWGPTVIEESLDAASLQLSKELGQSEDSQNEESLENVRAKLETEEAMNNSASNTISNNTILSSDCASTVSENTILEEAKSDNSVDDEVLEEELDKAGEGTVNMETSGNEFPDYTLDPDAAVCTSIEITKDGVAQTEIFTTESSISLGTIVKAGYLDSDGACTDEAVVTDKEIVWYTSLDGIASVENGVVTRNNYGEVTVFAVPTDGGQKDDYSAVCGKCKVHFVKGFATDITFEQDNITLQTSKKYRAVYEVVPVDKASQDVSWTSSDETVATVSSIGVIEAISTGEADITCSTLDGTGISKKIHVKVEPLTVKKINLNYSDWYDFAGDSADPVYDLGVNIGDTIQLQVNSYVPDAATNKGIKKWVSTNEAIATVDQNGNVKAVGGGHCEIRAYSMDEKCYGTCNVWVQPEQVALEDIAVFHTDTTIELTWEPVENIDGYRIYCDKGDGNGYQMILETTDTSYTVWNVNAGSTYKYKIATYIRRTDKNSYKHIYESLSDEKTVTTYKNLVVTSFDTNGVEGVGVSVGGVNRLSVNYSKKTLSFYSDDESIFTAIEHNENNPNLEVRITGVKKGMANLIIEANDEVGYKKAYPVLVYDFQKVGSNIEAEALLKSVQVKWKVENVDGQDGFKVYYKTSGVTKEVLLSMEQMSLSTGGDGNTYATYTVGGLLSDQDYQVWVAPYKIVDEIVFAGSESDIKKAHTPVFVNVDSITADDLHVLSVAESKKITAVVGPEDASEPDLVWIPYDSSILQVTDSGTVDATTRYAMVKGLKAGISKLSIVASDENNYYINVKTVVVPAKVAGFKGTADKNSVTLNWNAAEGATAYAVYRYDEALSTWANIATVTGTSYVDSGLNPDTQYQYKIGALITDEECTYEGDHTDSLTVTTLKESDTEEDQDTEGNQSTVGAQNGGGNQGTQNESQVAVPFTERKVEDFTIGKNYTTKVKLAWSKVDEADGYELYQYKSKKWTKAATIKFGSTKTIKKLKAGTSYKFRIRAYKEENGEKLYTAYTDLKVMTKPGKVKVTSVSAGSKKVTLKWKKVKGSGYEIQCCTSKKFKKNVTKVNVKKSKKTATVKKLKAGNTYYVRIRAYSKVNGVKYYGAWSNVKKVQVK